MKTAVLVLGLVLGLQANAQCPDLSGTYGRDSNKASDEYVPYKFVDGMPVFGDASQISGFYSNVEISYPYSRSIGEISMTRNSAGNSILSIGAPFSQNFILDGTRHFLSNYPESDGYFQDYTGQCVGNKIVFTEHGTNNSTQIKRVDSYYTVVTLELVTGWVVPFLKKKVIRTRKSYVANGQGETVLVQRQREYFIER